MSIKRILIISTTLIYSLFLFYVLWLPKDSLPVHRLLAPDKIYHMGAYFILSLLIYFSYWIYDNSLSHILKNMIIISIFHAGISEFFQKFSPGRAAGLDDMIANCLGVLLAYWVINWYHSRKSSREIK